LTEYNEIVVVDGIPERVGVVLKRQLRQLVPRNNELSGIKTTPRNRETAEAGCIVKE
jgi:hypothetical protein